MQTQWHAMSPADVLQQTHSNLQGLTPEEAQRRLQQQGPNTLPTVKPEPAWLRLARQFHNVLIYVLIGATVVTLLLQHYVDAGVIFAVIIINAIIGYYQEGKAESAIAGLRHMLAPTAVVIREGKQHHIPAEQLVVGDIVILEAGARVPADLRLLETHSLQVQEAVLTGESEAVSKQIDLLAEQTLLGSRACMAYLGTWVTTGHAQGVVTALYGAFQYALNHGQSIEVARSMALNTAVVLEIFHLFFIRNIYGPSLTWRALRGTRALWLAVILVLLAQALVTYLPAAQKLFGIAALNWQQVGLVICLGVALLVIVELEKQIRIRLFNWRL